MNCKEINQAALKFLKRGEWNNAQVLFFQNVREYPSHKTYNNLGNYLICEGLACKNGNVRNAWNIGMKYLKLAAELETSAVNLCAMAKAFNYKLRGMSSAEKQPLYQQIMDLITAANDILPTNESLYNILRLKVLLHSYDKQIIDQARALLKTFICEESVRLYFELLRFYSMYDEGTQCIHRYADYLPEDDILLFYAKFHRYDDGYGLCGVVMDQYFPNKYIAAAVLECCIHTNHLEQAYSYTRQISELIRSVPRLTKDKWEDVILSDISTPNLERNALIQEYQAIPAFLETDGYFEDM